MAILRQDRLACASFVELSFGDENSIVVALSEDESGENDIDNIEGYASEGHDTQNPSPRECHRQEGDEGYKETAKGKPKEKEDYK